MDKEIKGYYLASVYMGWIEEKQEYMQFESEQAYLDYILEVE